MKQKTRTITIVEHGKPALGTWQAVYLFERRASPHRRDILLHLIGE
jgi:thiamine phosphate synthase YjbQ (UPF0047 family)